MQAMISLYESYQEALHVVQELEAVYVPSGEISLITLNGKRKKLDAIEEVIKTTKKGGKKQPVIEAVPEPINIAPDFKAAFYASLALKEMTGVGDIIAAGWLVEQHVGETTHAIAAISIQRVLDTMIETGLSDEHASTYIEGIKRGATLIGVKVEPALASAVARILNEEHQPLHPHMRGHHYWQGDIRNDNEKTTSAANRMLAALIVGPTT